MRKIIMVIVAAVFLYVIFQGIRFYVLVQNSIKLTKKSVAYEQRIAGGKPRILIVGDSTGVGTGSADPKLSVAGRLGADFPNAFIQNVSVNGWKVTDALRNFPATREKFDIILLQIGANDILRKTPMPLFSASLEELFQKSTTAGTQVLALHSGNMGLAPFFPWPISRIMRARTLTYRAEYRRIAAEQGVTYVDLFHEAADDPFRGSREFHANDLLHLSAKGYGEWHRAIRAVMK